MVTRFVVLAVAWLLGAHYLPLGLWHVLPRSLLSQLSLPAYNVICQLLVTGLGVAAAVLLGARDALAARAPSRRAVALTLLVAPSIFIVASYVALKIAEPYLLEELATQGPGASRRNAGAFGQAVTQAPLFLTLLWGVLLAAVSEELMFRGALFGAVERLVLAASRRRERTGERIGERTGERLAGITAIVVSAVTFGAMHADMKGSVGIVRVVATTCLGLASGTVRWLSGTVLASMALHFVYNTISLGIGRGWFSSSSQPLVSVVPNPLLLIAVIAGLAAGGLLGARRVAAARARRVEQERAAVDSQT